MLDIIKNELENLKTNSAYRQIKTLPQGCLNLSSNDYLGIVADTRLREFFLKTFEGCDKSISNPSARLLSNHKAFDALERTLENKLGLERALCFNSGYHANIGIYSTFAKKGDVVFCDRLNHASIIDGIKLGGAKLIPFKHLDYDDLKAKLQKYRKNYKRAIISSETLFSMDGDFADILELSKLKKEFDCLLFIDEAHTFGVYGGGAGFVKEFGCINDVDLIMGTFGKAIGSYGAFCAGSELLINYLVNFARSFIFSTTFPPVCASFAKYILEQEDELKMRSKKLVTLGKNVRQALGLDGDSYIIPVVLGENELALKTSKELIEKGYYILPIRYPTVAKNTARIRISLSANMEFEKLKGALSLLNRASQPYKEQGLQTK